MSASEGAALVEDNRAEVMMEAGLGFVRAGDRKTALSFFADAAYLFREMHDDRSAAIAQAWLDAAIRPTAKRPAAKVALQAACSIEND
jgi:hypothetical protein